MRLTARGVLLLLFVSGVMARQQNPEEYARFLEGADRVQRMQVPRVVEPLGLEPAESLSIAVSCLPDYR